MRESLSIILTLLITGVLIGGIDFVWRNLDETLNDSTDQLTNGEGLASATNPAANCVGEGGDRRGAATGFATHQPEGPSRLPLDGSF